MEMDPAALFTLIVTIIAAVLLITEVLRPDLVALLVLIALGLSGTVDPQKVFAGFSGVAVMTLIAISMVGAAMQKTGVTLILSRWMLRVGKKNIPALTLVTFLTAAGLSLMMNNIAVVGIMLPAVMTLTRSSGVSPSKLMLPLAYGTILGGMATLFTTSNIVVSGALRDAGFAPFGVLDFLPIGLPLIVIGAAYMLTIGRKLLPTATTDSHVGLLSQLGERLTNLYDLKRNLTEIIVLPESPLAGKTISAGDWRKKVGLTIIGIIRNGQSYLGPKRSEVVKAGDRLMVHGLIDPNNLIEFHLAVVQGNPTEPNVINEVVKLAEVIIPPHSSVNGKTLRDLNFREKYHLTVIAVWRGTCPVEEPLVDLQLQAGDALLVQGTARRIRLLHGETDLVLLEEDPDAILEPGKIYLAVGIMLASLIIAATEVVPVPVVILAGAVLLVVTGCMNMNDAYRSIEWKVIFLIAGMWPLSTAIRDTGLASIAVNSLLGLLGNISPIWIALAFILVAMLMTQVMGGQVAALVVAPLALAAAASLQLDSRGLAMTVALGCSLAFPTPYGHPVNIMVMSPGGYNFQTFSRIGIPLTILVILGILAGIFIFWGL